MPSALKNFLHLLNISTQATEDNKSSVSVCFFMFTDVGIAKILKNMKYYYNWKLSETKFAKNKGKVFSCFACGGGSTQPKAG
ncbi:hypothetical protein [Capnocytophaga canis]|uniref:hypothetical protein n=1 Tax=Capnocytophaga canis TaxID=1848903 RepID=UPI0015622683|nr:hypothetical protein [Capnocytophaga canis]